MPASRILIEAAIDSLGAAERAVREGADRLEVCSSLDVGGLTPSAELIAGCLAFKVPCVAMARPRAGGFHYGATQLTQLNTMVNDVYQAGANGVVFGVLSPDDTVDANAVRAIVKAVGKRESVFHRAFDKTPYARRALDTLIACGVTRVLTSGQADTAIAGASMIRGLVEHAQGKIEILAGGTVRGHNVVELVEKTGVTQVHARATEPGVIAGIRAALDA